MTVYLNRQRGRWSFDFEKNGERYSGYCVDAQGHPVTSRRAALAAEAVEKQKAETKPKIPRAADLTIAQVVDDLTPGWEAEPNWANNSIYIREVMAYFGPARAVASISDANIDDYITFALKQPVMIWIGGSKRKRTDAGAAKFWKPSGRTRKPSTVNRYLPMLRAIFARAYKVRDPITNERAIAELPKIADLDEPKRKARPIPDGVLEFVMKNLPQHAREALIATLLFGFRKTEIFQLEIPDLDFEMSGVWLSHEHVKDNEDAFLPGSPEAMAFMQQLVDQARARGVTRLITWQRIRKSPDAQAMEPWRNVFRPKRTWATVMKKVEQAFGRRYRWHDIRAAYISYVANTSGQLAAQKLARHSDYRTTEAYVLVQDALLRKAARRASSRPALALLNEEKPARGRQRKRAD